MQYRAAVENRELNAEEAAEVRAAVSPFSRSRGPSPRRPIAPVIVQNAVDIRDAQEAQAEAAQDEDGED
jgi:hypothetical protein